MTVKPTVAVGQNRMYVAIDTGTKIHLQQGYELGSYLEGSIPNMAATGLIITRKPPDTR